MSSIHLLWVIWGGAGFFCNLCSFVSCTAKCQTLVVLHVPHRQRAVTLPDPGHSGQAPLGVITGISWDLHRSHRTQQAAWGTKVLNAESWNLFHVAAGWTSNQGILQCLLWSLWPWACGGNSLQPSTHYSEGQWQQKALTDLAEAAQKLSRVLYLQLSSCKELLTVTVSNDSCAGVPLV